jgi:uncharacterized protein
LQALKKAPGLLLAIMAQAGGDATLTDIPMNDLMNQVLPFRSSKYLEDFCEKMLSEGIASPADLLRCSREALETKLSTHAAFNFIEMADALSLRKAMDLTAGKDSSSKPSGGLRQRSQDRRGRSRSHDNTFRGCGRRDNSGGRGFRNNPRPHRGRDNRNEGRNSRNSDHNGDKRIKPDKPELWAAVERNDELAVQQLLERGQDPEEKFEGWTPLMKASEEGASEVIRMLLDKKVDIEACNKKGRTALSFAAAPSDKDGTPRPTPVAALRLLLENGADAKRACERRFVPKDYAMRAKRDEAAAILEEFEMK